MGHAALRDTTTTGLTEGRSTSGGHVAASGQLSENHCRVRPSRFTPMSQRPDRNSASRELSCRARFETVVCETPQAIA